jgi:hypothetical protein
VVEGLMVTSREFHSALTGALKLMQLARLALVGHLLLSSSNAWARLVSGEVCAAGGWTVGSNQGDIFCRPSEKKCRLSSGKEGFKCGPLYGRVCVESGSVETLPTRCNEAVLSATLTEVQFKERAEAMTSLLDHCGKLADDGDAEPSCHLLADAMPVAIARQLTRDMQKIREKEVTSGQQGTFTSRSCDPNRVNVLKNSPGSEHADIILVRAAAMAANDYRVEVQGRCSSACAYYAGLAPIENVCVGPNAKLGFHMATNEKGVDREYTKATYGLFQPEVQKWIRRHQLPVEGEILLQGKELRRIFQSCDDLHRKCQVTSAAWNERASALKPRIVRGDLVR